MVANAARDTGEGGLAGAYTPMDTARAAAVLRDVFGMRGTLKRFDTEKDDTFRVRTDDGTYVLKIANPDEGYEELEFQNALMRHVEARDALLPVPRVVATTDVGDIGTITDIDGQRRHVRMLTFLDGTPLADTDSTPEGRVKIGRILARLRHATEGFDHPGKARVYPWDVQNLMKFAHLLDEVDEPAQHDALARGLDRYRDIAPRIPSLRRQVLHNDFSKSNIVVDHDAPGFVTGIIDFGDAVETAIAIDVSTALLNQLPRQPMANPDGDLFAAGRDVLRGYLEKAELTDEELAMVPHFVMGRVIVRALLTLWRVKLFPDNETYIMRNTEQGWHQLDWFLSRSPEEVSDLLMPFAKSKDA